MNVKPLASSSFINTTLHHSRHNLWRLLVCRLCSLTSPAVCVGRRYLHNYRETTGSHGDIQPARQKQIIQIDTQIAQETHTHIGAHNTLVALERRVDKFVTDTPADRPRDVQRETKQQSDRQ